MKLNVLKKMIVAASVVLVSAQASAGVLDDVILDTEVLAMAGAIVVLGGIIIGITMAEKGTMVAKRNVKRI